MSEAPVSKAKWTFQDFQIVSPFLAYLCIFTWDAFVGPTPEFYKGIAFILLCINGVSSRTFGEVILLIAITIDIFDLAVPKHYMWAAYAIAFTLLIIEHLKNKKKKSQGEEP